MSIGHKKIVAHSQSQLNFIASSSELTKIFNSSNVTISVITMLIKTLTTGNVCISQ